eukprot:SAG11_NODE_3628_length_2326_cov_3.714414_2_plen_199_part_00
MLGFVVATTVVGLAVSSYEGYGIYLEPACTDEDIRAECDASAPFHEKTYFRFLLIVCSMVLYLVKAAWSYSAKMTQFNERLVKTLFFRVHRALTLRHRMPALRPSPQPTRCSPSQRITLSGRAAVSAPDASWQVIDSNRGALAVMLHEAEMQLQRETLICWFFLHFRWLGPEVDNDPNKHSFTKRAPGAGLKRSALDL